MKHAKCMGGLVLSFALAAGIAWAAPKTWVGGSSGDWTSDGNWSGGVAPTGGDDVILTNAAVTVLLDTSTPDLGSLVISNSATLVFTNWTTVLSATNVIVGANGTITAAGPFSDTVMSNRVNIACVSLQVQSNGSIDVSAKGFAGGRRITNTNPAYGPGKGLGQYYGAGGSHGGVGGGGKATSTTLYRMPDYSQPYGEVDVPIYPGSGGGLGTATSPYWRGGSGGGAVYIAAEGDVTIDGAILADGQVCSFYGGGGSGGSVYIECRTIDGSGGVISADGGDGYNPGANVAGGSGAGGRIAVKYAVAHQSAVPVIRFSVEPGLACYPRGEAEPGTLWFPNTLFVTETITHLSGRLVIPGFAAWSPFSLTISNCWVRFATNAFELRVAGDVTVQGTNGNYGGRLDVGGWGYGAGAGVAYHRGVSETTAVLTVDGDLILDGGDLAVYSAPLVPTGPDYGALVEVAGDMVLTAGAWVYPWSALGTDATAHRGSPKFSLRNLTVASGAGFDADYKGFEGRVSGDGFGPGYGAAVCLGGTYGGLGADTNDNPRARYDTAEQPRGPGSSGRGGSGYIAGGTGGGTVWIEADGVVTLDGTITARGMQPATYSTVNNASGGGSGGAVFVDCRRFVAGASAVIRADGGNGNYHSGSAQNGCGGGGGRVAVWSIDRDVDPAATLTAAGGVGEGTDPSTQNGEDGTIFWGQSPFEGTTILLQ